MELILAVLAAGPIGYFTKTRKLGLTVYLIAWAVVFPIQTVVSGQAGDWTYYPVNAAILALGIGLNLLGTRLRERRAGAADPARGDRLGTSDAGRA